MNSILHPLSENHIIKIINDLPQSLLLNGEKGVGLLTIAKEIAGKNTSSIIEPKNTKGEVDSENGTISIEVIRELYVQTRSKSTKKQIVIIDNAEQMSRGAQAAFLKLLEEPNAHTHFILTSHNPDLLVATIRSRLQRLYIQPLTKTQTEKYIHDLKIDDATKQKQLEFIAPGLPAELTRLALDTVYFAKQAEIMKDAREFISATTYQKLVLINKYSSNRPYTLQFLDSIILLARRVISTKPQSSLIIELERILEVKERIEANQNIRLQLGAVVL
jgi:DNA polymerase III subunit delta'